MRRVLLFLAFFAALAAAAQARLGETLNQCIERYGPVIETRRAELPQSDAEVAVFSKAAVTIMVEFKEGKAWHITFRKPQLTLAEINALLAANSASGEWSAPFVVAERMFRISADQQRLCVLGEPRVGGAVLEVMNRDYISQYRANTLERLRQAGGATDTKHKANPLPGF